MHHYRGSTPIYKGCSELLKGVDPSMNHRTGSSWIRYGESLKGVLHSMNQCRGCTLTFKSYGEALKGVDPSMNPRHGSTPIYKGCGESCK